MVRELGEKNLIYQIRQYRMKRRVVSATEPIALASGKLKVYILIQVERNVNGIDDFYTLDTDKYRDKGFTF